MYVTERRQSPITAGQRTYHIRSLRLLSIFSSLSLPLWHTQLAFPAQISPLHSRNEPRRRTRGFLQPCDLRKPRPPGHAWLTYHRRYGIAGLKVIARQKFVQELDLHLDSPDFPEACQEAYESTFHTDRGLRDVIIQAFRANPGLSLRPEVEMAVRETPGLAFELYKMASGMPITS